MLVHHSLVHWEARWCVLMLKGRWLSLGMLFDGVAEFSCIVASNSLSDIYSCLSLLQQIATYPSGANIFYVIYCESIFQCVFRNDQQFLLRISFVSKHHLVQPSDLISNPPLYLQTHTHMHCCHHQGSTASEIMSYYLPWLPKRSRGDRLITNNTFSEQTGMKNWTNIKISYSSSPFGNSIRMTEVAFLLLSYLA